MNRIIKGVLGCASVSALALSLMSAPVNAAPPRDRGNDGLSLKPVAGRFGDAPDYKPLGRGGEAQAKWTNKEAKTGKFSVLLEKSVETSEPAYAAALVEGVEGRTVESLETIGFSIDGPCTGGSPRFNLSYDNDDDGDLDGTAFYGCAQHATSADGDWTTMSVADATISDSGPVPSQATVLQLSVLVDEQGTHFIDDVLVAGETLGEPSD